MEFSQNLFYYFISHELIQKLNLEFVEIIFELILILQKLFGIDFNFVEITLDLNLLEIDS